MNRNNLNNTEHRANKIPNYAQAAKSNQQQQQQQQTRNQQPQQQANLEQSTFTKSSSKHNNYKSGGMTQAPYQNYKNSYTFNTYNKPKENTPYLNRKPSVQLPMAPPTDTTPIQFGSINQPSDSTQPVASNTSHIGNKTNDIPTTAKTTEVQFGSLPAITDTSSPSFNYRSRTTHQQKSEIPKQPRNNNTTTTTTTTNDGRLFTQPYAPRQGETPYNHNRYYNNYRNNGYIKSSTQPHHSPNQPYHHQYSPQQQQSQQRSPQQQNTLPPSPMNHRTSPNQNAYSPTKKNTLSPHIPQGSPQNIQMTTAWPAANQYFYPPQYPVTVPYNMPQTARTTIIPPSTTRKRLAIIDPATGMAVNTSPISLNNPSSSAASSIQNKEDKQPDFIKPPHVSKAVLIVDPAIRDRELREKKEREEAEKEAARKAEEEKKEAERKAQEEKERKEREERERKEEEERLEKERLEAERLEKERLEKEKLEAERLEKERLEKERLEAERLEKERLEAERLEKERLEKERLEKERLEIERARLAEEAIAAATAALEKQKKEEELRRKEEEEQESKRIISELEAEKKRKEASEVTTLNTSSLQLTQSPVSSPNVTSIRPAKLIEDLESIEYPPGIKPPTKTENNKYVYTIDFLLQFQQLCSVTDVDLSAISAKQDHDNSGFGSRSSSMRQSSDRSRNARNQGGNNNNNNFSPDAAMYKMGSRDGRMEMGKFNMGRPLAVRNNSSHMERQGSHGASRGGMMMGRGNGRGGSSGGMKIIRNPPQQNAAMGGSSMIPPLEPVAPLEKSENRWVPRTPAQSGDAPKEGELMSQEFITRKVNALLNKLTLERFDSISNQIFDYARQSAKEQDGQSLRTVIRLTFEKACDEPNFASMWARLCRKMYDSMTDDICDTSIVDDKGNASCGIPLFRKYLFNRCQVEFEKGWKVNMPKLDDDAMMTEEYYAAAKAKRQGLGLIQFIGELFKLEMLSERIMYGCVIKLCNDPSNAGDEEAESLCKLLTTIGKALDSKPKTSKWVDIVITRMKNEMMNSPNLTSRVKFMIQDLLDLRKDRWIPRHGNTQVGPTTIAKIHEMAEKAKGEKEAAVAAAMKRNNSSRGQYAQSNSPYNNSSNSTNNSSNHPVSRTGSYRPGGYQSYNNNANSSSNNNTNNTASDGWSTVSQGANKTRTNELSNFGKMDRSRSRTNILGPSNSPFPSLSRGKSATNVDTKGSMEGRASPATNMFSALLSSTSEKTEERKKLQLTPRTVTTAEPKLEDEPVSSEKSPSEKPKLSEEAIKRKSKNILEEYFSINDKAELTECVKELDDPDYRVIFIGEMFTVVEKKAQDVEKICEVIKYLNSQELLEKDLYIKAIKSFMETYDDLTIDVPQAPKYVAQLLHASSITPDEVGGDSYESLQNAYSVLNDN